MKAFQEANDDDDEKEYKAALRMKITEPSQYCCSESCRNCEELPDGWKVILKTKVHAVRPLPSRWLDGSWHLPDHYDGGILSLNTFLVNVDEATLGKTSNTQGKVSQVNRFLAVFYSLIFCCLGLVLPLMTCSLDAFDPTEENARK